MSETGEMMRHARFMVWFGWLALVFGAGLIGLGVAGVCDGDLAGVAVAVNGAPCAVSAFAVWSAVRADIRRARLLGRQIPAWAERWSPP